jgi:hypothetical protein
MGSGRHVDAADHAAPAFARAFEKPSKSMQNVSNGAHPAN